MTAYLLGVRHAFDADHIAAIDNSVRRIRVTERSPVAAGFWFSAGHSTVVFIGCLAAAIGWGVATQSAGATSAKIDTVAGIWGPTVSGLFLLTLAVFNGYVLRDLVRGAKSRDPQRTEKALARRGFLARVFSGRIALASRPRHMYAVGFLFGLGLDTATSVGLLFLSAATSATSLPWLTAVTLPILFSAGMTLCDTLDAAIMNHVYAWSTQGQKRRMVYDIAVTTLSVAAATLVGSITLAGVLHDHGATFAAPLAHVDLENAGFALVVMFFGLWMTGKAVAGRRIRLGG